MQAYRQRNMEDYLRGWTYYNEYSLDGNQDVFANARIFLMPHEMLLVMLSIFSIVINNISARPLVYYKSMKIPFYKYLMEWCYINTVYMVCSPGLRRIWMVVFDQDQKMYSLLYGLERGAQLTEMLIPIGYLMDASLNHPLPNCNALIPLTWISLISDAVFISVFSTEDQFQQLLCRASLMLYVLLAMLTLCCHLGVVWFKPGGNDKHIYIMTKIITVHLVFWFLYWLLNAVGLFFPDTPYHFYLSVLARCIGCCSSPIKLITMTYYDKAHRDYFFQTLKSYDVEDSEYSIGSVKEVHGIVVKISPGIKK